MSYVYDNRLVFLSYFILDSVMTIWNNLLNASGSRFESHWKQHSSHGKQGLLKET